MAISPYSSLPASAYWRSAVAEVSAVPEPSWYTPKWPIGRDDRIATAGSCFAQHIGRRLRKAGYHIIDSEPAPSLLPQERHLHHNFGVYSARYGNVYTARQLLQLVEEAFDLRPMSSIVWEANGRFVDALRPTIDAGGHATPEAVLAHRRVHLEKVRMLLLEMDLLVFTLGLTETWECCATGRVFPVCPGTVAGSFDPAQHRFRNLTYRDTFEDLTALRAILAEQRRGRPCKMLLTVSPVPLTATASGHHVMVATVHSKSILRAVAGQMAASFEDVDYFPSYEIVTNAWSSEPRYAANLRTVLDTCVESVMTVFMASHADSQDGPSGNVVSPARSPVPVAEGDDGRDMAIICDEELLEAFGPRTK